MPLEPFRFIHASHLLLDHQFHAGAEQPAELREIFEDVTILAFDNIIDACLTHAVDFLLLTGNSFDSRDPGLRGQIALARGLDRLAAQSIPVFILAGDADPWPEWLPGLRFAGDITFVGRDQDSQWPVLRNGRTIATICNLQADHARPEPARSAGEPIAEAAPQTADSLFFIGLRHGRIHSQEIAATDSAEASAASLPAGGAGPKRYLAWGGAESRQTIPLINGIAHDPGAPQGLSPKETGPRGCTLIDVNGEGQIKLEFIPTAVVRWEQLDVAVTAPMTEQELQHAMHAAIGQVERQTSERVWLASWNVSLPHAEQQRSPLPEGLSAGQLPRIEVPQTAEKSRLVVVPFAVRVPETSSGWNTDAPEHRLALEFAGLLDERLGSAGWSSSQCLAESPLHGGPWEARLESIVRDLDQQQIRDEALGLGLKWFTAEEE